MSTTEAFKQPASADAELLDAFRVVADWLDRYHTERPHSALGYLTPKEYQDELAA
jgi:transposase InsO family protein